tara:strand:- start:316 stop:492 length:177 start_codon:yes stop_codon:yes gene_type:complete
MTIKNEITQLDDLRKIINISDKIDIIMKQSLKLMDIVTENQKIVGDLKAEQIKLEGKK